MTSADLLFTLLALVSCAFVVAVLGLCLVAVVSEFTSDLTRED